MIGFGPAGRKPARRDGQSPGQLGQNKGDKMQDGEQGEGRGGRVAAGCVAILAFSCALDLFFYSGFFASDDAGYLTGAWRILSDGALPARPGPAQVRLTVVGWNVLVAWLFGFNIALIAGSFVFFHQALNLLTFLLARRLFDSRVGLLAMYLVATVPLAVTFSTTVLPDLPLSCFLLLSLLLFLWSYDRRASSGTVTRRYAGGAAAALPLLLLFLSGLSVGLAYMAKEAALVALPFYLGLWLSRESRHTLRAALTAGACFALGVLVVLLAEWVVLSYLTGHSYVRLGWTLGSGDLAERLREHSYGYYPLERLAWVYRQVKPWFTNTRFDYLLAGAALLYPFVGGRKLAVWGLAVWFFAFHTWGSTRLTEYVPPPLQGRYFTPVLPLLFVVYSFLVVRLLEGVPKLVPNAGWRTGIRAVLTVAFVVHPLFGLHVADRRAGKVYWADLVRNSVKAIQTARLTDDRPVVLSGTVSWHLKLPLELTPVEGVISAGWLGPDSPTRVKLADSGFCYVEVYPLRKLPPIARPAGLDAAIHPLIQKVEDEEPEWLAAQNRVIGDVEIAARPGTLRRQQRFDSWHKRSEELAHLITGCTPYRPDLHARSVYLYEWVPNGEAGQSGR